MKKYVWGRVGLSFPMTEDEFRVLSDGGHEAEELVRRKLKEGDFLPDGDSYFYDDIPWTDHWTLAEEVALDL